MATRVYKSGYIYLIDGTPVYATPLKIKYLRGFMAAFEKLKLIEQEDETIDVLIECAQFAMQQYYGKQLSAEEVEDLLDIKTLYEILDYAAGIKLKQDSQEPSREQARSEGASWDELDLAKLESELFLLGIWKDYEELEMSLSMPELTATLNAKRESDYNEKKFLAAMQGVDLDKNSGKQDEWEKLKARVFSNRKTSDPNDILALQGQNASNAGFGIGMGLDYQRIN